MSELLQGWEDCSEFSDPEKVEEVDALALVCCNCVPSFVDCGEKWNVFCFGCGAPNAFKPDCVKCQKKGTH